MLIPVQKSKSIFFFFFIYFLTFTSKLIILYIQYKRRSNVKDLVTVYTILSPHTQVLFLMHLGSDYSNQIYVSNFKLLLSVPFKLMLALVSKTKFKFY